MKTINFLMEKYRKYKSVITTSQIVFLAASIGLFLFKEESVARWLLALFFISFIFFILVDLLIYKLKGAQERIQQKKKKGFFSNPKEYFT